MKQKKIQYIMMLALSVLLLPALTSCLGKNLMLPERSLATTSTEVDGKENSAQKTPVTEERPVSEVNASPTTGGFLNEALKLEEYYKEKNRWPYDQTETFVIQELGKAVNGLAIKKKGVSQIAMLLHPDGLKDQLEKDFEKFTEKESFKKFTEKENLKNFATKILVEAVTMTLNKIKDFNNEKNNKKNNNQINIQVLETLTKSIYTEQGIFTAHTCKVVFERVSKNPETLTDIQKIELKAAINGSCLSNPEKTGLKIMLDGQKGRKKK